MNKQAEILKAELELRRTGLVDSPEPTPRTKGCSPARVVTLATLSRSLPDRLIAGVLARSLHAETRESVLLVQIDTPDALASVRDFAASSTSLSQDHESVG